MKKVALSLLALALVGTGAFADATADVVKNPLTVSLNVNAESKFGFDLDTSVYGFTNASTAQLTLWILNGSSEKTGEGDVHGYIKAADVKFGYDDKAGGTAAALSFGDVTAKIVAGDLYVKIWTNSDPSVGYNYDADNDNGNRADDTFKTLAGRYGSGTEWNFANIGGYSIASSKGVEVGYAIPSVVTLTGQIGSNQDWTTSSVGIFEGSAEASVTAIEKVTLKGKFYAGDTTYAVGTSVGYDATVLAPFADFNYNVKTSKYTSDFGAQAPLADGLKLLAIGTYNSESVINAMVNLSLAQDKLVGPLKADVGLQMLDVTKAVAANAVTEIFAKVGLKATDTLSLGATVDTYNTTASTDSALFLKAQAEYTGISLTTLGVYWDSSDLGAAKSTATAANGKESKLGQVYFKAKVAY